VLLGHGNGTFDLISTASPLLHQQYIVANDFNNDGKLDVAVLDEVDNQFAVLLGHGTGALFLQPPLAVQPSPISAITGDFTGDGVPGLAINTANENSTSYLLVLRDFSPSSSSAAASLAPVLTGLGGHTITAAYSGDGNFVGSSGSVVLGPTP
jgi:FG-GAP-like repeat